MSSKITDPHISITQSPIYYNRKWGFKETIVLSGKIIDHDGYAAILNLQESVLSTYSAQTSTLTVGEISRSNVFLQSIDFGSSDYLSNSDYEVTFISYPNDYFTESGVLNPVNEWEFSEGKNGILSVSHNVSARGLNTSNLDGTALTNAKNFVQNLVYPNATVIPTTLTQFADLSGSNFILKSRSENTNRITGEYSVTENYELDLVSSENAIIQYSVNVDEPVNGFHTATIDGTVEGGLNVSLATIQTAFSNLNLISIIEDFSGLTLNTTPTSKVKSEDSAKKLISFTHSYDDSVTNTGDNDVVLELSLDKSIGENNVENYSLKGSVLGRLDLKTKWAKIESYYNNNINIYKNSTVASLFSNYFDIGSVNTEYKSSSVIKNEFKGRIDFTISLDNKEPPPNGFEEFEYTIQIKLPSYKTTNYALVGTKHLDPASSKEYILQKLGFFNRSMITINGYGIISDEIDITSGKENVDDEVNNIAEEYLSGNEILTQRNLETNPLFGKKINFSYSWEFDGSPVNDDNNLSALIIS